MLAVWVEVTGRAVSAMELVPEASAWVMAPEVATARVQRDNSSRRLRHRLCSYSTGIVPCIFPNSRQGMMEEMATALAWEVARARGYQNSS